MKDKIHWYRTAKQLVIVSIISIVAELTKLSIVVHLTLCTWSCIHCLHLFKIDIIDASDINIEKNRSGQPLKILQLNPKGLVYGN